MMGTEGRRPAHEIAPSNDVYDLVVFRSSDIEDLQIFEPPAPSKSFRNNDISSAVPQDLRGNFEPPARTAQTSAAWPAAPRLQFGTATVAPRESTQFVPVAPNMQWGGPTAEKSTANRPPTFGSFQTNGNSVPALRQETARNPTNTSYQSRPSHQDQRKAGDTEKVKAYNTVTGKFEMVERQSRSYAAVVSDGAGRFRLAGDAPARMVPKSDYDFQSANALLPKEASRDGPREMFYDKTSSFFDSISCESTTGKDANKNERRWNIETFGVAAPAGQQYRHHGQRRGGYHHNSGRGRSHRQEAPQGTR